MFLALFVFSAVWSAVLGVEAFMVAIARQTVEATQVRDQRELADTQPDNPSELVDAVEWLKKAGVVHSNKKPTFANFFDEAVNVDIEDDDA